MKYVIFMNVGDYPKCYLNVFPQHYLWLSRDFKLERGCDRRFENLSLDEDMDRGYDFGFEPSLPYGGWLYVHIGADMQVVTVVDTKYASAQFGRMFPCGYGLCVSYSRSCIQYSTMVELDGGCNRSEY